MDRSGSNSDALTRDMARLHDAGASRRAAAVTAGEIPSETGDPALAERTQDHLRSENVARLFQAAAFGARGASGEATRLPFRAVAGAAIDRACRERLDELRRRGRGFAEPARGFEAELALLPSPSDRRRCFQSRERRDDALRAARHELCQARHAAARALGARTVVAFLGAGEPVPPESVLSVFTHGAIDPLDDAVRSRARERVLTCRVPLSDPLHAADVPVLEWAAEHGDLLDPAGVVTCLRRLGRRLEVDPDVGEFRLVGPLAGAGLPELFLTGDRPVVAVGAVPGPAILGRALGLFGVAVREAFLRRCHGPAARWADPAFGCAADVLFRRLVLCPVFREWAGLAGGDSLEAALRLEEALAPRRAWAYLYLALQMERSCGAPADEEAVEEILVRATGRPATPGGRLASLAGDPVGASALRGTVYGLLLEERLLTRFGRQWFVERRAGRLLRECWEAEPLQTVEDMAAALDLGTIETTPVRDRCRP